MVRRNLIVNADDFNTDEQRNRGILLAAREGVVSSVSVIANFPLEERNARKLIEVFGRNVGIHLNLTKGKPLTSRSRTLTGQNGEFFSKREAWRRGLTKAYDYDEVRSEFAAQITKLKEAGINPDHIDGNNHIHVFPKISMVVAQLAKDFGILRIRLPLEAFGSLRQWMSSGAGTKLLIAVLSKKARRFFGDYGLRFPDYFAGMQFPRVSNVISLRQFASTLPAGTTELMCHPGYQNERANPFSTVEREQELLALTDSGLREAVRVRAINIIGFNDLE